VRHRAGRVSLGVLVPATPARQFLGLWALLNVTAPGYNAIEGSVRIRREVAY
jgi:hypothetical protein